MNVFTRFLALALLMAAGSVQAATQQLNFIPQGPEFSAIDALGFQLDDFITVNSPTDDANLSHAGTTGGVATFPGTARISFDTNLALVSEISFEIFANNVTVNINGQASNGAFGESFSGSGVFFRTFQPGGSIEFIELNSFETEFYNFEITFERVVVPVPPAVALLLAPLAGVLSLRRRTKA